MAQEKSSRSWMSIHYIDISLVLDQTVNRNVEIGNFFFERDNLCVPVSQSGIAAKGHFANGVAIGVSELAILAVENCILGLLKNPGHFHEKTVLESGVVGVETNLDFHRGQSIADFVSVVNRLIHPTKPLAILFKGLDHFNCGAFLHPKFIRPATFELFPGCCRRPTTFT